MKIRQFLNNLLRQVSDDVVSNHLRGDSFSWVSMVDSTLPTHQILWNPEKPGCDMLRTNCLGKYLVLSWPFQSFVNHKCNCWPLCSLGTPAWLKQKCIMWCSGASNHEKSMSQKRTSSSSPSCCTQISSTVRCPKRTELPARPRLPSHPTGLAGEMGPSYHSHFLPALKSGFLFEPPVHKV